MHLGFSGAHSASGHMDIAWRGGVDIKLQNVFELFEAEYHCRDLIYMFTAVD